MDELFGLRRIGTVRLGEGGEEAVKRGDTARGTVEVLDEYAPGLEGLDGFSHLILLTYLDKVTPEEKGTLKVKPRRFLREGVAPEEVPTVGVFSTASPHRPNPIAVTIVRLLRREGARLEVEGLDLFDSTPVIDIKPYTEGRAVADVEYAPWYSRLKNRRGKI